MKKITAISVLLMLLIFPGLFYGADPEAFNENEKACLLSLARNAIEIYLKTGTPLSIEKDMAQLPPALLLKRGCFVTLHKKGTGLRGCIGIFERERSIAENVANRAVAAAVSDPRFRPVTLAELKDIRIEISILTVPEKKAFHSPQELLDGLRPLVDGVILETRYGASTYLPQVWEQLPDKEEFLSYLCRKHGAPSNAWKKDFDAVRVSTYQAIVFSEKNYGGTSPAGCISGQQKSE